MRREVVRWAAIAGIFVASGLTSLAQSPSTPAAQPATPVSTTGVSEPAAQIPPAPSPAGGKLHGMVKSGNIPLPGVTVTAQNTLTGKRFSTTTDITGAWILTIPQNGRYVIRTQFAGFAPGSQEAVLNAANHDQTVSFDLMLASRAAQQQENEAASQQAIQSTIQQLTANGAQSLSLISALGSDTESQGGPTGVTGAALPSVAGNSDFGDDSVAISGQTGAVSPLAGLDMDRVRDAVETLRAQGVLPDGLGGQGGNFGGGGGLGGGLFGGGGGFGGPGGFGGGGGRGNFRGFNPNQPHGAIFWMGSNSALNAEPFSLRGQTQQQPPSGTNRFGITFMSPPYLPHLTKPSGKDMMFMTLSGQRSSNPLDQYATVPTDGSFGTANERAGNIPGLANPVTPIPAATNLLQFFPAPNLPGYAQNYHLLTTAQTNSTQAGVRYMRSLGKNAILPGGRGGVGRGGSGRRSQSQGLRQSINFNYNWTDSASDSVNVFPQLGGKSSSNANSVQAGYTVGYHKITSIFNANWNRSTSQATNYFTNKTDIASQVGIYGPPPSGCSGSGCLPALNANPLNYGLPNVTLSSFTGMSEQQPSFALTQTISVSEVLSWIYGKHNLRFGGDYRRVHRDFLGDSTTTGSLYNGTGTFYFTGLYTGSSLADFLLGEPQETTIDASAGKSYLRENVWDAYVTDDWRARNNLTLNYGLRYEFFAPFTEKYGHLAFVDTNAAGGFTSIAEVQPGSPPSFNGPLPASLVLPFRTAIAPRVGLALRLPKQTVVRAGFGINYTVSQYATFTTIMAHQPPFANEQTNEVATQCAPPAADCLSLANGFPAPATLGNYALDPHYHLPYVQVWNLDVQKTLPWNVVLNMGYSGSRGNHLDITSAPRASASSPGTDPTGQVFNYEQSAAFSKFNAGQLRLNKRLSKGISLSANYQYSHSIDDAGSVGGTSTVVAQNWQDLKAEEGNSSFDQRHRVSGTYLYELPFGKDKFWVTSGAGSHILEGFSVSGSFTFATGTPLTPTYQAAVADVTSGTAGTQRPNYTGVSVTAGAGSLKEWFNPAAFTQPPNNSTTPNCPNCGNVSRNSIAGPGTLQNNMALSKTMQLGGTRSSEFRATANNVFNTVQYAGVDTNAASPSFGQVNSAAAMRSFQFTARFRF
ncbi:MAG TPA: carboxypeptidase-like regulatory domain-containing protein [Terracidiphilus sp.]